MQCLPDQKKKKTRGLTPKIQTNISLCICFIDFFTLFQHLFFFQMERFRKTLSLVHVNPTRSTNIISCLSLPCGRSINAAVLRNISFPLNACFFQTTLRCYSETTEKAERSPPPGVDTVALDMAMAVNKLKRTHQATSTGQERKEIELKAWTMLNELSEESIMSAQGKAVALLLNSWAYFSKHWERGKDGPAKTEEIKE